MPSSNATGPKKSSNSQPENGTPFEYTLRAITLYHVWQARNKLVFENTPRGDHKETVNNIWTEFERSCLARVSYLEDKKNWWSQRHNLCKTNIETLCIKTASIEAEISKTLKYILPKSTPYIWKSRRDTPALPGRMGPILDPESSQVPPPCPILGYRWRLTSIPQPRGLNDGDIIERMSQGQDYS
jgi:hypothetical protein